MPPSSPAVAPSSPTGFRALGVLAGLISATEKLGYSLPTPIQVEAIPAILQGRDVLAGAETGSGKTAAFVLPLLQRLAIQPASQHGGNQVRALILVPTRELAAQIGEATVAYGQDLPAKLKVCTVFGGSKINPQMMALRGGADMVIATPGRLLDLLAHNAIKLDRLEILVLDEADRMLSLGFSEELSHILAYLPKRRQNLMFSATFPDEVRELIRDLLKRPLEINVAPAEEPRITQRVFTVNRENKNALLIHLIKAGDWPQVLVFASAKNTCNRILQKLSKAKIQAATLHGDLSQGARLKALQDFKAGKVQVLIATDVAARGIDIKQLPCVVNFELPRSPNDYIHRIGRTGRAGQEGQAISLICHDEYQHFQVIEKRIKQRLPREQLPGFEADERPSVTRPD